MTRRISCCVLPLLMLAILVFCPPVASAQLDGRLAPQPLGVGYMRDVNQLRMFDYMKGLGERLEVGATMFQRVTDEQLDGLSSGVDRPVNGVAWYMVQGLIPSFDQIYFQEVKDLADAKRMINAQKAAFGDAAVLKPEANDSFRLSRVTVSTLTPPAGTEPEEYLKQLNSYERAGFSTSYKLVDGDEGKPKVIQQTWSYTQHFRFHDSMLFSSSFEELFSMDLPSRDSLTSQVSSSNDIGAEVNFDRIPSAIKQLGWNMLSSGASPMLQRRDEEPEAEAALRKVGLGSGLDIVKAVMFDVDKVDGWLRFASAESDAVKGQLNFNTRRNSGLVKQLDELSSGSSRMAPVLKDEAALTFHTCFRVSEEAAEVLPVLANWAQYQLGQSMPGNSAVSDAAARIGQTLLELSDRRDIELLVKMGYSEDSGGVIYGGLQVGDNPLLLESLFRLFTETVPAAERDSFSLTSVGDMQVISVKLPTDFTASLQLSSSMRLTDAYLVHQGSCLWLAVGGNKALSMINQCIQRCEASGLAARTPIATLNFDAAKWLAYPQDEEVGVGGLLSWLDANDPRFPWSPLSLNAFYRQNTIKPAPLLQRVFELGGAQDMTWTAIADKSGLRIDLDMGEAIANYHVARMMDLQDKQLSRLQENDVQAVDTSEE